MYHAKPENSTEKGYVGSGKVFVNLSKRPDRTTPICQDDITNLIIAFETSYCVNKEGRTVFSLDKFLDQV